MVNMWGTVRAADIRASTVDNTRRYEMNRSTKWMSHGTIGGVVNRSGVVSILVMLIDVILTGIVCYLKPKAVWNVCHRTVLMMAPAMTTQVAYPTGTLRSHPITGYIIISTLNRYAVLIE